MSQLSELTFICFGYDIEPGCGAVLTAEERYYYHSCCEACITRWTERVAAWKAGSVDRVLDELYSARPSTH